MKIEKSKLKFIYDSILIVISVGGEFGGDGFLDKFKGWESVTSFWDIKIVCLVFDVGDDVNDLVKCEFCCEDGFEPMTSAACCGDIRFVGEHGDRRWCCWTYGCWWLFESIADVYTIRGTDAIDDDCDGKTCEDILAVRMLVVCCAFVVDPFIEYGHEFGVW